MIGCCLVVKAVDVSVSLMSVSAVFDGGGGCGWGGHDTLLGPEASGSHPPGGGGVCWSGFPLWPVWVGGLVSG